MSLLLITDIRAGLPLPEFGGDFAAHIARKRNPSVRSASLTAWNLLARGMGQLGFDALPAVRFGSQGKPKFIDSPVHFSLAHSGNLAAALLSDAPCGVDIERVRAETARRLRDRCMSDREQEGGFGFFECWTKKECIGKLDGKGIDARPTRIDTLDAQWTGRFFTRRVTDSSGKEYALTALCGDANKLILQKIESEAL